MGIFSVAVQKLCSRLSAVCSPHAVIWMCFNSRKGLGCDTKQTELALRRIIIFFFTMKSALYLEVSLSGGAIFYCWQVVEWSCYWGRLWMLLQKSSKNRQKKLESKYCGKWLHNYDYNYYYITIFPESTIVSPSEASSSKTQTLLPLRVMYLCRAWPLLKRSNLNLSFQSQIWYKVWKHHF